MCGIYGVIPRNDQGLYAADMVEVKQMMLDTIQRGEDSSGLFVTDWTDPKAAPTGVKVVGGPHNIIYNNKLWKELTEWVGKKGGSLIGHGRLATRGNVNAKNAHPFQHEHITLVHNGTLSSGVSYAKKGETDIEVDSHALAVAIAEKGILEALASIKGAYAIICHDSMDGCLYIARNDERPLHVYSNLDRHYIMSEYWHLDALITRNGKWSKAYGMEEFSAEILYKIDLKKPKEIKAVADIGELRKSKEEAAAKAAAERRAAEAAKRKTTTSTKEPAKEIIATRYKEVVFEVKSMEAWKNHKRYTCLDQNGQFVFFLTDTVEPYIGMVGRARIHSYHTQGNMFGMFVKHKEITWANEADPTALKKEDNPACGKSAMTFITYNNKRINADEWEKKRHEGCDHCQKQFLMIEYRDVILMDDENILCKPCNEKFQAYGTSQARVQ